MTSTALARPTAGTLDSSTLTPDQVALVKRQLMASKRAPTDDELALFIYQCDRTKLDPFSDQIYAIYRWDTRLGDEKMRVQVSIHGLRLVADRTQAYAPGAEYWCGSDGVWRDVWLADEPPVAARVTIRKLVGNHLIEFSVPALWKEFAPRNSSGKLTGLWPTKPALMLAKCSEALGLRKAFPNETSGLYIREEFGEGDDERADRVVDEVRTAFNATEEPTRSAPPASVDEPPAPEPAPVNGASSAPSAVAAEPMVDATAPVTEEEAGKMVEFFASVGAPESFWRMGLMTLGFESLTELNKGQAHELMADAKARFGS